MSDNDNNQSGGSVGAAILVFILSGLFALLLLVLAALMGLAALMQSWIAAVLVLAGFFILIALLVYFLSIRAAIRTIASDIDTVVQVARTVQTAYDWVTGKTDLAFRIVERWLQR